MIPVRVDHRGVPGVELVRSPVLDDVADLLAQRIDAVPPHLGEGFGFGHRLSVVTVIARSNAYGLAGRPSGGPESWPVPDTRTTRF